MMKSSRVKDSGRFDGWSQSLRSALTQKEKKDLKREMFEESMKAYLMIEMTMMAGDGDDIDDNRHNNDDDGDDIDDDDIRWWWY